VNWEWIDLLWHLLAYPIYQILGTIRHEACHALTARSFGADILEFKFLPGRRDDGQWYWGYVRWRGDLDRDQKRLTLMMPYILDTILIFGGTLLLRLNEFPNFHWMAFAAIMLIVSPALDVVYNLLKWAIRGTGDFAKARELRDR